MRHKAIALTLDIYGHLFPGQEADTVARLPAMLTTNAPEEASVTGTTDAIAVRGAWEAEQEAQRTAQ